MYIAAIRSKGNWLWIRDFVIEMLDKNEYGSLLYSKRSCARAIIGRARALFSVFLMPQSLEIVRKVGVMAHFLLTSACI